MGKGNRKTYIFWIGITEAVGLLAGLLIRIGVENYSETVSKPPFAPPNIVFPIAWTVLYALMGLSAARVRLTPDSKIKNQTTNLYVAQLIWNFFWPLIFFNLQAFGFALVWLCALWLLVFALIFLTTRVDNRAAWLLTPYLAWLTFAVYLNAGVYLLN